MNKIRKTPAGLDFFTVSSEELVEVDVIMCVQPQLWQTKAFFEVQSSKNIIDVDSDNENGKNNRVPVLTSSEMRNIMKNSEDGNEMNNAASVTIIIRNEERHEKVCAVI
ncbi:hypothetical protein TNCV_2748211 [Trichonephila clavipes]|nr:hypothetical protein TNCV_2748211 [Trichonephila clavipes]